MYYVVDKRKRNENVIYFCTKQFFNQCPYYIFWILKKKNNNTVDRQLSAPQNLYFVLKIDYYFE